MGDIDRFSFFMGGYLLVFALIIGFHVLRILISKVFLVKDETLNLVSYWAFFGGVVLDFIYVVLMHGIDCLRAEFVIYPIIIISIVVYRLYKNKHRKDKWVSVHNVDSKFCFYMLKIMKKLEVEYVVNREGQDDSGECELLINFPAYNVIMKVEVFPYLNVGTICIENYYTVEKEFSSIFKSIELYMRKYKKTNIFSGEIVMWLIIALIFWKTAPARLKL